VNIVYKTKNSDGKQVLTIAKSLFVYDSSRGLAAEVRKKFGNEYNIVCCVRAKDLKKFELNDFFAAIVIINDYDDFLKIDTFKFKIKNLILSTSLKKSYFTVPLIPNTFVFDLFLPREQTIEWLRDKLAKFENKVKVKIKKSS
jgi:hypothetical protein